MATIDDVRAIALALPGVEERVGGHTKEPEWRCGSGHIAWVRGARETDRRQLAADGRSWPDGPVLAVQTETAEDAEGLVAAAPDVFFTIPHFAGHAAVLVRLDAVDAALLREIIDDAWLLRAPRSAQRAWLAERGLS